MSENFLTERFTRAVSPDFFRPLTRPSGPIYVECARRLEEEAGLAGRLPLTDAQEIVREVLRANPTARLEEDEGAFLRDVRQRAGVFLNKLLAAGWVEDQTLGLQDRRIIITFSRRYAKSFPALSHGFEIETELTVHALELRMPHAEFDTAYSTRPEGSHSKLSTYRDGWRILKTICKLFISERPLQFFSIMAAVLAAGAIALAIPLLLTYLHTGLVPRLPTAVLATGAMLAAMLSMVCGVVMHAIRLARREAKRLRYLAIPGVGQFRRKP